MFYFGVDTFYFLVFLGDIRFAVFRPLFLNLFLFGLQFLYE